MDDENDFKEVIESGYVEFVADNAQSIQRHWCFKTDWVRDKPADGGGRILETVVSWLKRCT